MSCNNCDCSSCQAARQQRRAEHERRLTSLQERYAGQWRGAISGTLYEIAVQDLGTTCVMLIWPVIDGKRIWTGDRGPDATTIRHLIESRLLERV